VEIPIGIQEDVAIEREKGYEEHGDMPGDHALCFIVLSKQIGDLAKMLNSGKSIAGAKQKLVKIISVAVNFVELLENDENKHVVTDMFERSDR
jgi:hypothetical protein